MIKKYAEFEGYKTDEAKDGMEAVLKARKTNYDVIIMDPPSYGRGPGGEVWKLESEVYALCEKCASLLSEKPLLFLLNSYTTGLSPSVMGYMLGSIIQPRFGGRIFADEIGLPVGNGDFTLPCGSTAIWNR